MSDAEQAWAALSEPWRAAFEEAWASWRQGSLGVGAVVTEGEVAIVARGHNQFFHSGPGLLSGTYMAHAEMNALAQLPVRRGPEYCLYSTFEPCYMCMSTIFVYRVNRVYYAAPDPVWEEMHDWLRAAPMARLRGTRRECLGGEVGTLGHVLHLSRLAPIAPPKVLQAHERSAEDIFDFATAAGTMDRLSQLAAGGSSISACDALAVLWEDLVRLQVEG